MMGKNDIDALLDFYLFSDLDDEKAVDEYLEEEGLDFNSFYEDLGIVIKKKKAEIKLSEGKSFKEKYYNELKRKIVEWHDTGNIDEELIYAFRNLEDLDEDEMKKMIDDNEKIEILKKLSDN